MRTTTGASPGKVAPGGAPQSRTRLRELLAPADFRRLLATRFAVQWGDGLFLAGMAGAVLFNPERGANPLAIAAGFTVMLLPYSVVGPFAGALLDRWDRRRVLVVASLLRATLVLLTAAAVGFGWAGTPLYVGALLVTGAGRFVGSGLSAALPHVVPAENLVQANAVAATLGSVMAVVGAACATGLRAVLGTGDSGSAWTTSVAMAGSLAGAVVAAGFARGVLGPDEVDEPGTTMAAVARGLLDGGRASLRTPSVLAGFIALMAHRAAFGASLLITVLLLRFHFHNVGPLKAGMGGLGEMAVAGGAGILVAGMSTAHLVERFGRRKTICGSLVLAAVVQLALGLPMTLPTVLLAAFFVVAAGQVVKLCVDAAAQSDIGDEVRGRVFALYDTLFNATQVAAIALVADIVPLDGQSRSLMLATAATYLVGIAGYLAVIRRHPGSY